jgi:hypothetical protein
VAYHASVTAFEFLFSASDAILHAADPRWISRWVSMAK